MKFLKYIFLFLCIYTHSFAQEAKDLPSIAYVYPAGVQRGETSYVTIGGKNFENVKEFVGSAKSQNVKKIIVSGEGVKATLVGSTIPADRSRAVGLINELQKLLIERGLIDKNNVNDKKSQMNIDFSRYPDLQKKRLEIIQEQRLFRLMKSSQASFAETLNIKIEVDKNAKLGKRVLKIISDSGVSNSMAFYIGDLPEYAEYSIRSKSLAIIRGAEGEIASEIMQKEPNEFNAEEIPLIQKVIPPLVINGQMDLLETDIYKFHAKKGQDFVVQVQVRDLIPFIADAVPGWFQATISIKNDKAKEIAYQDDFFQSPDPLLVFKIPEDGFYTLEIKDAIYRGREDFVYRITLGDFPFILRTYPLVGNKNKDNTLSLIGLNLNRKEAKINANQASANIVLSQGDERQSTLLYKGDNFDYKDISKIDNLSIEKAETIEISQGINSILKNKGDKHFYKLETKERQRLIVEVFARRLGSPIDTHLEIFDTNLNSIVSNDDNEDMTQAFATHHADSKIDFVFEAKSTYYIVVRDTQNIAGDEYAYALSICEPRPDFEIKASPSTINLVEGKSNSFKLSVFRKDGFKFPIEVFLKNAPEGLSLSGGYIGKETQEISMVLSCDKNLKAGLYNIELVAKAKIGDEELVKKVVPCEGMLQAFYYSHLVPMGNHQVYILPKESLYKYQTAYRIKANEAQAMLMPDFITMKHGEETELYIASYFLFNNTPLDLDVELRDSSKGVSITKVENRKDGCVVTLKSDAKESKKGQCENLIIDIYIKRKPTNDDEYLQKARSGRSDDRLKIDTLKAIGYKII